MRKIVLIPDQVLTKPAKPVTVFDKKLARLIRDMQATLMHARNPKGVGLAAPQVGVSLRIFVAREKESSPIRSFINPAIVSKTPIAPDSHVRKDDKLEGCLSIPKVWGKVTRADCLTLTYQDVSGHQQTEDIGGFLAVIIQHEVDHLDGILFTRRVLEQNGKLYEPGKDRDGKEILEEIEI